MSEILIHPGHVYPVRSLRATGLEIERFMSALAVFTSQLNTVKSTQNCLQVGETT